jgi:hypothetical protein
MRVIRGKGRSGQKKKKKNKKKFKKTRALKSNRETASDEIVDCFYSYSCAADGKSIFSNLEQYKMQSQFRKSPHSP